jgi:hypothetical protein
MFTLAYELTLFYLRALGYHEDEREDTIKDILASCDIEPQIDFIANTINQKIHNEEELDHPENWATRYSAYKIISDHFFEYIYCRYWNFKKDGASVPEDLSEFFKEIFNSSDILRVEDDEDEREYMSLNVSDILRQSSIPQICDLIELQTSKELETLDIQARQYIFVYVYEHGINIGYY